MSIIEFLLNLKCFNYAFHILLTKRGYYAKIKVEFILYFNFKVRVKN